MIPSFSFLSLVVKPYLFKSGLPQCASVHYPIFYGHFGKSTLDTVSREMQIRHSTVNRRHTAGSYKD